MVFAGTVSISISAFGNLINVSKGTVSSTIWFNICVIIARIKKDKSMMKEKKKKYNEIALFGKTNLVCIKVLFSSFLTGSYIECDYLNLINVLTK